MEYYFLSLRPYITDHTPSQGRVIDMITIVTRLPPAWEDESVTDKRTESKLRSGHVQVLLACLATLVSALSGQAHGFSKS